MTKESIVSLLKPAMKNPQPPQWRSAKWVGALDLPATLAPSIELLDSGGYRKARLLVRHRRRPMTFVDVDVDNNVVDGVQLSEIVSEWNRGNPSDIAAPRTDDLPFITVIIGTRNRRASLEEALASVLACDYPRFEVIVVDNASNDDATVQYVTHLGDPRVRALREPVPGVSMARNAGIRAARGDVVAFTDDDVVVDPMWLRWLGHAIQAAPTVGCVTGLVPGGELRTPEQCWFENQMNWSKNLTGEEFDITHPPVGDKLFPFHVALYGAGANFAMPRSVIGELGGFDEALGAGSPTGGGDDIDMFVRVLVAGYVLLYEPAAIVWHRHRADMAGLVTQVRGYGLGLGAWLTKVACDRSLSPMALPKLWPAMRHFHRLTTPAQVDDFDVASNLRRIQIMSTLRGPLAYGSSRRRGLRANPLAGANIPDRRGLMRIAMVSSGAFPLTGGIETHIHEVCTRLGAAGVEVTVLTTDRSGNLPLEEEFPGYRVLRSRAYPRSRDYYLAPALVEHLVRNKDYDVIHVQGVHNLVPPTALAVSRMVGIPTVLTFHTGGHSSALRVALRPLQWRLLAPLLRSSSALVAVSDYERKNFAAILGVDEGTIRLIRNGCDPLPIDPSATTPEGRPLLVSVGRLERYKGHHRILRALPAILAAAPDARLVIVGSGPYEQPLRAMAKRLGVGHRVSICSFGADRRGSMGKLIADADVFCLLSEYEAHPVAAMEAVGAGTKVLVADTSGLSELGRAGLAATVALDASAEQVAAAVLAVAAAPGRAPTAMPTWDDCAEQLHHLYREVLSGRGMRTFPGHQPERRHATGTNGRLVSGFLGMR
jgi:glycosyltransferase involved in cell wall biosynthesis